MPIDRHSFQERIAIHYAHLESAKAELARQALRLANNADDIEAQSQVNDLKAEIAGHREAIDILELAKQEAARGASAEGLEKAKALQAERIERVDQLNHQIEALAFDLLGGLEALAQPLSDLGKALKERYRLAVDVCAAEIGHQEAHRRFGARLLAAADAYPVKAVLVQGLLASGLGEDGPSLAPWVSAPTVKPSTRDELTQGLQTGAKKLAETLVEAPTTTPIAEDI